MKYTSLFRKMLVAVIIVMTANAAFSQFNIGTIPKGDSIVIQHDVTIIASPPPGTTHVASQWTIMGSNFASFLSDDPDTAMALDSTITILVLCPTITVTNPGVTTGTAGAPFSETFTASGGTSPYTFTTVSVLPTGLSLSSTGVLSGTPIQAGTFNIVVTATESGSSCSGNGPTYILVIGCPAPTSGTATPSSQTTCSGVTITTIVLSGSPVSGTVYNWTRDNNAAVTGITASGSSDISGTLTNTTNAPVTVTFTITPTYYGTCNGTTFTATVTVDPTPDVNQPANQVVCNNTATAAPNFTGSVAGTMFSWTNNTTSVGVGATGVGNIPSFTATNATNAPVTATVTVTPHFSPQTLAYVSSASTNNLFVINTATNTVVTAIPVGANPRGVSVSHDGTRVYVANFIGNSVSVINTATNTVIATVPIGAGTGPYGLVVTPDGSKVYVADAITNLVSVISTATNTVLTSITVGNNPYGIAVSPDGSRIYAANSSSNTVSVINTATNTVVATVPTAGVGPLGVTVSPDGNRLYACNSNSNNVAVINTATNTLVTNIITGSVYPYGAVIGPDGSRLYVPHATSGTVAVINTATNAVLATIPLGGGSAPYGAWVTPDGSRVYVPNTGTNNVSVINTATNLVVATVPGISVAIGFGNFINGIPTCTGTLKTFTITVNPTPVGSASPQTICSGGTTNVTLSANTPAGGTTYSYMAAIQTTPTGGTITGQGSGTANPIAQTLTNTGTTFGVIRYTVTPSYTNGGVTCSGAPFTVDVTVNPTPVGSASPQTICSGGTTNVTLSANTSSGGTTYSYTAAIQTTPTGGTITGQGSGTANPIAQTLTNTGTTFGVIRYTVTPSFTNGGVTCAGATITVDVTVNPTPVGSTSPQTICSGGTTNVTLSANTSAGGTTYSYTAAIQTTPTGGTITGQGSGTANPIAQTLTNTGTTFGVIRYTVTPSYTNAGVTCAGATFTVDVTVNPTPVGSASPQTICSGGTTNVTLSANTPAGGTTYSYTAAIQTTPTGGTITGQGSGTANPIAQTLTNTGTTFGVIRYTVTPSYTNAGVTCAGTPFTVDVTVNPTPVGSASPQTICSGGTTNVTLSANTPAGGTTYSYMAAIQTTPTGGTITGQGSGTANPVAQTLSNTGTTFGVIRYTVTPSYTNAGVTCAGTPFTVDVTVNPTPVGSALPQTICSGGTTNVTLSANTPAGGTTYSYTAAIQTTPTGGTITGQGSGTANPIAQTLTNSGTTFGVIRYTVTPSYTNGGVTCSGAPFTVDVTVNPTPVGSASPQTICSGGTTNVTLSANTPAGGTTYSYTAAIQTTPTGGTITGQGSGTANPIAQTLTNTGTTFGVIRYTVTPSYTNAGVTCAGTPFTVDVTVNPIPNAVATPQTHTTCSGVALTTIVLSGNVPGTVFNWTRDNTGTVTGIANSGAGDISGTPTNTTNAPITVTFTIIPGYTNGGVTCTGTPITSTVIVGPPLVLSTTMTPSCTGGATGTVDLTVSGGTPVYTYDWSNDGAETPDNDTQDLAGLAGGTYTVTVTDMNGCTASTSVIIVQSSIMTLTTMNMATCTTASTGAIDLTVSGGTPGYTYDWSNDGPENPDNDPQDLTGLTAGTYTITVTDANGCISSTSMTVTGIVCSITNDPTIADPCICKNNATTLTDGQFDEVIEINAPANQTWTISAVTGFYSSMSAAPPLAPTAITVNTVIPYISGTTYRIQGIHIDAIGYSITVTNNQGTTFTLSNTCAYPNPVITSPAGPLCSNNAPFNLTGNPNDANIVSESFTVNGNTVSAFDPGAGPGTYTVVYTVNGGVAKAFGPNDPGCTQSVTQLIIVNAVPVITDQPDDVAACRNSDVEFSVSATIAPPATLGYQWQELINGVWTNIDGETGPTLTLYNVSNADNNSQYRCIVSSINANGVNCPVNSDAATLMVHQSTAMACDNHLNVSVDHNCEIDPVLEMFLESGYDNAIFYEIIIKTATGLVVSESNLGNYKGQTLTVSIRDICDGNSCWGTIRVEDKLYPRIDCGPIRSLYCYDVDAFFAETLANATLKPTWSDNCGAVSAQFTTHKFLDGCDGGFLKRKWVVTDASGNTAACDQHIEVHTDVDWYCPAYLVILTCKDDTSPEGVELAYRNAAPYNNNNNVVASGNGVTYAYPHYYNERLGTYLPINGVCNYYATYSDIEIGACGQHCHGNKKVIRTWTILDWCTGRINPCTQIIKAVDSEAPTFIVKDTIISTAPWYCEGDFFIPNPWELHDNCDINPTWTVKSSEVGVQIVPALLNGAPHPIYKYRAIGVPKGTTHLKYTASDCCGNEVTIVSNVTVVDRTPPVPVAKRDIVIGLTPGYDATGVQDGQAKLYCPSIDNGSYDNCSPVRCEIRRPVGSPNCGNLGNGNPKHNNNETFNNLFSSAPYSSNDTDGGLFVKFCCADLTTSSADFDGDGINDIGYHQVIMRIWDDGNMDGIIGNAGDNWNETWANVKVECKVPPVITCPADATIHCDWAIQTSTSSVSIAGYDFTKTGLPEAYGVCTNPDITFKDVLKLNQCGIGIIERTFTVVEKGFTRTCLQYIYVLESLSQQEWVTTFPSDWTKVEPVDCTGPTEAQIKAKGPINTAGPCDVIGTSTKQWVFDFEEGVCRKWKVEYKYVNWCDGEERGPYYKYFFHEDLEAPEFDVCRDTMYAVDANCVWNGTISKIATDDGGCIPDDPDRWLKWTVLVDLWADGITDLEYTSFLPSGNDVSNYNNGNWGAIADDNGNGIRDIYVSPTKDGAAISIKLPPIEGKMSNHKVSWKVTDGCHNFTTCHENFMVADKKAPTPVCVPLSTALMQDPDGDGPALPMVELWAIDFMNKAYDNCTPDEDLLYTFENVAMQVENIKIQNRDVNWDVPHYFNANGGQAAYPARDNNATEKAIRDKYLRGEDGLQLWNPVTKSSAKVWASTSLTPGEAYSDVDVKVTVWDKKFNYDYCWTTLKLICNTCEGGDNEGGRIAGTVATSEGQSVNNVTVSIDANIVEYPKSVVTPSTGTFSMSDLPKGLDYEVTASKGGDYLNGVSTLDLVMIQRHILGLQPLNSPYKLIAADANNDRKVSAADLTDLRKLILGITNELPNNSSWRFPVSAQTMDGSNPFPFVEKINVLTLNGDVNDQNFVAVKIGDVNGNVSTNVSGPTVEARSNKNIGLLVSESVVNAGATVEIPVSAANFNEVFGYQFTMKLNGASYVGIQSGAIEMNATNVGVLANDVITMSYASSEGVTLREDETLFTLILKADKAGNVGGMMEVGSTVTAAESYAGNSLEVGKVSLGVRTAPVASIELFQNEPNPFKGQTVVSFSMPVSAKATISVYDVTGKLVNVRNIDANKGYNSEIFTAEQLGASGVLYYTLVSGEYTATKKMIIIE